MYSVYSENSLEKGHNGVTSPEMIWLNLHPLCVVMKKSKHIHYIPTSTAMILFQLPTLAH